MRQLKLCNIQLWVIYKVKSYGTPFGTGRPGVMISLGHTGTIWIKILLMQYWMLASKAQ